MPKDNSDFKMTRGSKYVIRSLESKEKPLLTCGTFKGYTAIGHDEGICMELDEKHKELQGKIRVVPTAMILAIDVIESAKDEGEKEEDSTSRYFG